MTELVAEYDIGQPVTCRLLHRGLNDTYLVTTAEVRYVLRVYRYQWRSLDDILYELDLLTHLQRKGAPVSSPIPRKDGSFTHLLHAPEGDRYAVLFTYAPGVPRSFPLEEWYVRLYGQSVAEIHNALDDFSSPHTRFPLDLDYLLDRPLRAILPLLEQRADDAHYLQHLAGFLKAQVTLRRSALEQGACHGDFHGQNCHLSDQQLTFFDFDCCGPGWRVFDLATFRWNAKLSGMDDTSWTAFLEGYTSRRPMNERDLEAVPLFVAIRHIWLLGLDTGNGDDWGYGGLDGNYFDWGLTFLRDWEAEHLTGMQPSLAGTDTREPAVSDDHSRPHGCPGVV